MLINGRELTIYTGDTPETVIQRIAADMNTHPRWLVFEPEKPTTLEGDYTVEDYLIKIRGSFNHRVPQPPYPPGITEDDVVKVFVATNVMFENEDETVSRVLLSQIEGSEQAWRNRYTIQREIEREIQDNANASRLFTRTMARFDSIVPVNTTEVDIGRVQFTIDFGKYDGDLTKLFGTAVPNSNVPYVVYNSTFKIFADFVVDPDWLDLQFTNIIFLKVFSGSAGYTNAAFTIDDSGILFGTIDTTDFSKRTEFTERVIGVFTGFKNTPVSSTENLIVSKFVIPYQCIDPVAFADILMMDNTLNRIVVIDEFVKPSRVSASSVYVKRVDKRGTVSIILKQTERMNEYGMRNAGEWYLLCRIKTFSEQEIDSFRIMIAKIIRAYNDDMPRVSSEYRRMLPQIHYNPNTCTSTSAIAKKRLKIKGNKGLRSTEPDVFYPGYTRLCSTPPAIVESPEEAVDSAGNRLTTMEFPTKGETIEGRTVPTRMYACTETPDHPFIGLRSNKSMSNADVFPYVPCCFTNDQTQRKLSGYRKYFAEEQATATAKESKHEKQLMSDYPVFYVEGQKLALKSPNVQVDFGNEDIQKLGELSPLPDIIEKFFDTIIMDPKVSFVKCYIRQYKYSVVEAIMYAKHNINYTKQRISTVNNAVRTNLSTVMDNIEKYAMAAKQELYDSKIEDIVNMIRVSSWTPSVFVRMIEVLMNCSIFVFNEFGMVVPRHSKFYSKTRPVKQVFFIYENRDGAVELIGMRDRFGPPTSFTADFFNDSMGRYIINTVYTTFLRMTAPIVDFEMPSALYVPTMNVTSQIIDIHGKCRVMVVDQTMTIVPDVPIPPYAAPAATALPRVKIADVIAKYGDQLYTRGRDGKIHEVHVAISKTVRCTILVNDDGVSDSPPLYDNIDRESIATTYVTIKRRAFEKLHDTINWLAAKPDLDSAIREYVTANGGLTEYNRRLMYACRHWMTTHQKPYKFTDSTVVDNVPSSFVLVGEAAVRNLIEMYSYDQSTYTDKFVESSKPYYLLHERQVYLTVKTESLDDARDVIERRGGNKDPPVYTVASADGSDPSLVMVTAGDGEDKIVFIDRNSVYAMVLM